MNFRYDIAIWSCFILSSVEGNAGTGFGHFMSVVWLVFGLVMIYCAQSKK